MGQMDSGDSSVPKAVRSATPVRRCLQSDPIDPHGEEMDGPLAGVAAKLRRPGMSELRRRLILFARYPIADAPEASDFTSAPGRPYELMAPSPDHIEKLAPARAIALSPSNPYASRMPA